jgi:hypothetical protein
MANIYYKLDKTRLQIIYRSLWTIIFSLGLYILSINFLLSSPQHQLIAQSSSSPEQAMTPDDGSNQTVNLEAARQQYLLAWNDTAFTSQFDLFIEEGSSLGYGAYKEHVPANVFRPGETIVLYVEPIGFGHQPITDPASSSQDGSDNGSATTLYLVNMTADYIISDSNGTELQTIEHVPVGNLISHRQNLELFLTLTLRQDEPFPLGDYIVSYVIHDQVSGQGFQIDRVITIDDSTATALSSLEP